MNSNSGHFKRNVAMVIIFFSYIYTLQAQKVWLGDLNIGSGISGWKTPQANTNIEGLPLNLNGIIFKNGVGVHANSSISIALNARVDSFIATVGVDYKLVDVSSANPVVFKVFADGELAFQSKPMKAKDSSETIRINLRNKYNLELEVVTAGNRTNGTFADWCNAYFVSSKQYKPFVFKQDGDIDKLEITSANDTTKTIINFKIPKEPIINLPMVLGIRPKKFTSQYLAVSGEEPKTISVSQLPKGLIFDPKTRIISGSLPQSGEYAISIEARNKYGKAAKTLLIKAGTDIALTPPMGWNSWNVFGPNITQETILAAAKALKTSGLADFGWSYINIDDGWQGPRDSISGAITPNNKFPAMTELVGQIHQMGLKVGIYSTPWVTSYMKLTGGSADLPNGKVFYPRSDFGVYSFHKQDAAAFASWGIDLLKYDWAKDHYPYTRAMQDELLKQNRNIVLSISGAVRLNESREMAQTATMWRVNGDIEDNWKSVYTRAFYHTRWSAFQKPGHWADLDMLVVGKLGWGKELRPTGLTPWEQVSHISLWALLSTPMILGCDLTDLDPFTFALLSNHEIIAVNQDPKGIIAKPVLSDFEKGKHIFIKEMSDGSVVIGFFNTSIDSIIFDINLSDYKKNAKSCLDVWLKKEVDLKSIKKTKVLPHGCKVFRVK